MAGIIKDNITKTIACRVHCNRGGIVACVHKNVVVVLCGVDEILRFWMQSLVLPRLFRKQKWVMSFGDHYSDVTLSRDCQNTVRRGKINRLTGGGVLSYSTALEIDYKASVRCPIRR